MNKLLDAVIIKPFDWGTVIFIGFIFIAAILCFSIFLFKKSKTRLENRNENEPDFMCSCKRCSEDSEECIEKESCTCAGSCLEEAKEEIKKEEITEIISEIDSELEKQSTETTKERYNSNTITRAVLIECLRNAGVKGITKLSRADLLLKFQEMGLEYPEKL